MAIWRIRGHGGCHGLRLVLDHVGVVGLRMHHGRCAVHVRRREILGLRLHVCAFEVLDGWQRHGHSARRRAAIAAAAAAAATATTATIDAGVAAGAARLEGAAAHSASLARAAAAGVGGGGASLAACRRRARA